MQVEQLQQRLHAAEAAAAAGPAHQGGDLAQDLQRARAEAEDQRQRCAQLQQVRVTTSLPASCLI